MSGDFCGHICNGERKDFKGRVIAGSQPYSHGMIARQSNAHDRLLAIQQRMAKESSKDEEQIKKQNMKDIVMSKFHIRTDKKNYEANIRNRINERLKAVEEELNCKRDRLRDLLYKEEQEYLRECVTRAQKVSESRFEEQKRKVLEYKLKQQAEDAALAAEKRMQQYMSRCEELRTFREALNTKEVREVLAKQIEDNKKRREANLELDKMWHEIAQKNYALMVAYEKDEERKRLNKMQEVSDILQNQIKGRKLYEEEEQRLKMEERANLEKLELKLAEEEELAKREKELKMQEMFKEMEEVNRKSKELRDRRKAQEKVLDDIFCQLIQKELEREQDKQTDNRSQLKKERELYMAYLEELERKKKKVEAESEELRAKDMAKLEAEKRKIEIKKCEAALKLKEEVLEERRAQILCLEKQNTEKKKLLEEEARLAELFRLEALEAEKEKEMALKKSQKEYQMELAKQIEQDKQILLKQCEEEERQLKDSILKEEAYINKIKDTIANRCSAEIHPFMKKFRGLAI